LAQRPDRGLLVLASACAALAFAAKYGGVLLLPVICVADLLGSRRTAHCDLVRALRRFVAGAGLSSLVFTLTFVAVDVSAVREWRSFTFQALTEAGLAHQGHLWAVNADPLAWARQLLSVDVLAPAGLGLGVIGLLISTIEDGRAAAGLEDADSADAAVARLPLELWTLGYLALLVVWIGDIQARYALPVLPGLALFAAASLRRLPNRFSFATTALACLALLGPPVLASLRYEATQLRRMQSPLVSERIAGGRWLAEHFDPSTPVLRDAYSYVPSSFAHTEETFALSHAAVASFHPRLIVTDADIRVRFRDPANASGYVGGEAAYNETAATYRDLDAGLLACYPHLRDFGTEQIYGEPAGSDPAGRC
jgi:hypothetical protein